MIGTISLIIGIILIVLAIGAAIVLWIWTSKSDPKTLFTLGQTLLLIFIVTAGIVGLILIGIGLLGIFTVSFSPEMINRNKEWLESMGYTDLDSQANFVKEYVGRCGNATVRELYLNENLRVLCTGELSKDKVNSLIDLRDTSPETIQNVSQLCQNGTSDQIRSYFEKFPDLMVFCHPEQLKRAGLWNKFLS